MFVGKHPLSVIAATLLLASLSSISGCKSCDGNDTEVDLPGRVIMRLNGIGGFAWKVVGDTFYHINKSGDFLLFSSRNEIVSKYKLEKPINGSLKYGPILSPDGSRLLVMDEFGARVFTVRGKEIASIGMEDLGIKPNQSECCWISSDRVMIYRHGFSCVINLNDVACKRFPAEYGVLNKFELSRNGKRLVGLSLEPSEVGDEVHVRYVRLRLYNLEGLVLEDSGTTRIRADGVIAVEWSSDSRSVFVQNPDNILYQFNVGEFYKPVLVGNLCDLYGSCGGGQFVGLFGFRDSKMYIYYKGEVIETSLEELFPKADPVVLNQGLKDRVSGTHSSSQNSQEAKEPNHDKAPTTADPCGSPKSYPRVDREPSSDSEESKDDDPAKGTDSRDE